MKPEATLRVAALLYPQALASSVTLPMEILGAAEQVARARRRPAPSASLSLFQVGDGESVTLGTGIALNTHGNVDALDHCDLLLLPAIWRHPERVLSSCRGKLALLNRLHAAGSTICSVGSASNLLAAAGLLDGRPATTHWHDFDRFEKRHPRVMLKRRHLITRSDRLYCVGSVNSIADFMVHWVGQHYGDSIARRVEAQFSPEARQDFQSATFLAEAPEAHHDALVRDVQDTLRDHLEKSQSLTELARHCGLSPRTLNRRFRQATGLSPMGYLREWRLREARSLLKHSDLAISEIAWRCGFSSPSRFSQVFTEDQSMSPRAWRNAVRGKRFSEHAPARTVSADAKRL